MGLRPGHCYSSKKDRAFSRYAVRVHRKNYVGAVPGIKTRQFNMGNPRKKFNRILDLVVEGHVQVRDNAIESSRITINRFLHNEIGSDNYFMRIRIYPFQLLRENKQAQGAGADRVSQGMSQAFGQISGRAARVRPGQPIISVLVDKEHVEKAKKALLRAKARLPVGIHVEVGKDVESIGTRPKEIKEVVIEEEKPEEEEEGEEKEEGKEGEKKEEEEGEGKEEKGEKGKGKGEGGAEDKGKKEKGN